MVLASGALSGSSFPRLHCYFAPQSSTTPYSCNNRIILPVVVAAAVVDLSFSSARQRSSNLLPTEVLSCFFRAYPSASLVKLCDRPLWGACLHTYVILESSSRLSAKVILDNKHPPQLALRPGIYRMKGFWPAIANVIRAQCRSCVHSIPQYR
jgi:hypothetical protein